MHDLHVSGTFFFSHFFLYSLCKNKFNTIIFSLMYSNYIVHSIMYRNLKSNT